MFGVPTPSVNRHGPLPNGLIVDARLEQIMATQRLLGSHQEMLFGKQEKVEQELARLNVQVSVFQTEVVDAIAYQAQLFQSIQLELSLMREQHKKQVEEMRANVWFLFWAGGWRWLKGLWRRSG